MIFILDGEACSKITLFADSLVSRYFKPSKMEHVFVLLHIHFTLLLKTGWSYGVYGFGWRCDVVLFVTVFECSSCEISFNNNYFIISLDTDG